MVENLHPRPLPRISRDGWALAFRLIGALVVYFLAAQLSISISVYEGSVTPFWIPAGLGLALVIYGGPIYLFAVLAGELMANAPSGLSWGVEVGIAMANTLEIYGAWLVFERVKNHSRILSEFREPVAVLVATLVGASISAGLSAAVLWANGQHLGRELPTIIGVWMAGDALAMLQIAPLVGALSHVRGDWRHLLRYAGVLALVAAAGCWMYLGGLGVHTFLPVFPALLLAWFVAGRVGCSFATVALTAVALWAQVDHSGIFLVSEARSGLALLQLFLLALSLISLFLLTLRRGAGFRLPLFLVGAGWAMSTWAFLVLLERAHTTEAERGNQFMASLADSMTHQLETHIDALRAGRSFYHASTLVTPRDWTDFVQQLELNRRYPGVHGVGFVRSLAGSRRDFFVQRVRRESNPGFAILPLAGSTGIDADFSYVVEMMEPSEANVVRVGMDLATDPRRRAAADRACDTGLPWITERIDDGSDEPLTSRFDLFLPVYLSGNPPSEATFRRTTLVGWIYASLVMQEFFEGVLGERGATRDLAVIEGDVPTPKNLVFATREGIDWAGVLADPLTRVEQVALSGRTFTIVWAKGYALDPEELLAPAYAGSAMALLSVMIGGLVMSLQNVNQRAHALTAKRTEELETLNRRLREEVQERSRAETKAVHATHEAEAANRAKSDFLATMSHEIRTPMNSVIGYTDLLLSTPLEREQADWVRYIQSAGRTLLTIINDILDFSKIEANELVLEYIAYSPERVAEFVLAILEPFARDREIKMHLEVDPTLPRRIMGDPTRFQQILMNLVNNAIKFTEKGSVTVLLRWRDGAGRPVLQVEVLDTGVGISAELQQRLFRKFQQADSSTTRRFGGTGLGLAICRHLVDLHKGSIEVESVVGEGTRMRVLLPTEIAVDHSPDAVLEHLRRGPETAPQRSGGPDALVLPEGTMRHPHLLVVDDVPMNLKLVETVLKSLQCTCSLVQSGKEALELLQRQRFDLVLMDCQMPEMDGFETTRRIRELEQDRRLAVGMPPHLPIVALTANVLEGTRERCLRAGMDDYIGKPFRRRELVRVLQESYMESSERA